MDQPGFVDAGAKASERGSVVQEIKQDEVEEVGGGLSFPGDPFGFPQPLPAPWPGPRNPGPLPIPEPLTDWQRAV